MTDPAYWPTHTAAQLADQFHKLALAQLDRPGDVVRLDALTDELIAALQAMKEARGDE